MQSANELRKSSRFPGQKFREVLTATFGLRNFLGTTGSSSNYASSAMAHNRNDTIVTGEV